MKKYHFFFLPAIGLLSLLLLNSCDEGRIYEKVIDTYQEGRSVKLTGNFSGITSWPLDKGYSIVLAGFKEGSSSASISKALPFSEEDGARIELTLNGVGDDVSAIKLCVINRLNVNVADFKAEDFTEITDTLHFDAGTVDVGMFNAIQQNVFNTHCIACHGQGATPSGGLVLLEGQSYNALVGRASTLEPDRQLVSPGNAQESFVHLLLGGEATAHYDHTKLLPDQMRETLLKLIDDWIDYDANP